MTNRKLKGSSVKSNDDKFEWNIAYNYDWQEYKVRVLNLETHIYDFDLTYFTDDKQDAFDTRDAMKRQYDEKNK